MAGYPPLPGGISLHVGVFPLLQGHKRLLDGLWRAELQHVVRPARLVIGACWSHVIMLESGHDEGTSIIGGKRKEKGR